MDLRTSTRYLVQQFAHRFWVSFSLLFSVPWLHSRPHSNTLPTNECAVSIISPDLVEVGRIYHTSLSTCAEFEYATGRERYFQVRIPQTDSYAELKGVAL